MTNMRLAIPRAFTVAASLLSIGIAASSIPKTPHPQEKACTYEIVTKEISIDKPLFLFNVQYPVMLSSDKALMKSFNSLIQADLKEFLPDEALKRELLKDAANSIGSNLTVGYVVGLQSEEVISLRFAVEGFFAGSAHPFHYSKAVNFLIKSRRQLLLDDVFSKGSNCLDIISKYCIAELKRILEGRECTDEEWLATGAGPKEENYQNVLLIAEGLAISFNEYKVAAYVCGGQGVFVPYSVVAKCILPTGPLASYGAKQ